MRSRHCGVTPLVKGNPDCGTPVSGPTIQSPQREKRAIMSDIRKDLGTAEGASEACATKSDSASGGVAVVKWQRIPEPVPQVPNSAKAFSISLEDGRNGTLVVDGFGLAMGYSRLWCTARFGGGEPLYLDQLLLPRALSLEIEAVLLDVGLRIKLAAMPFAELDDDLWILDSLLKRELDVNNPALDSCNERVIERAAEAEWLAEQARNDVSFMLVLPSYKGSLRSQIGETFHCLLADLHRLEKELKGLAAERPPAESRLLECASMADRIGLHRLKVEGVYDSLKSALKLLDGQRLTRSEMRKRLRGAANTGKGVEVA